MQPKVNYPFIPFDHKRLTNEEMIAASGDFYDLMKKRRSIREFSSEDIPDVVIEQIIHAAGTAPSGANKQPWTFCVVRSPFIKKEIRIAAEREEELSYSGRMSDEWLRDLAPLGTDANKPFLESAPVLIAVFKRPYELNEDGSKHQNYYVSESVGIACGFLIAAIHQAGLVTLTHTPSPMNFLEKILERPSNERAYLLLPVGYPATNATVPDIKRKPLDEIMLRY
jgi:iodotyrosine deiodinase